MEEELRKTGIAMIGDIAWGAHFCLFYETKEDLLDLLIPYFKAGLENNEFCLCVASEPVIAEEAERALREAVPNFEQYLAEAQIEIVSHRQWYLTDDRFDPLRVRQGWIVKLEQALARGYAGMRFAANVFWLEKQDWDSFAHYEGKLDDVFGKLRIMALCAYSLARCTAADMLDVVRHHQFSLARRNGAWERLEGPELQRAHAEIEQLNADLERRVEECTAQLFAANEQLTGEIVQRQQAEDRFRLVIDTIPAMVYTALPDGSVDFVNQRWLQYLGLSLQEVQGWGWDVTIHPEDRARSVDHWRSTMAAGQSAENELRVRRADGVYRWILGRFVPLHDEMGNIVKWYGVSTDIDDRKRAEDELRQQKEILQKIFDYIPVMIAFVGEDGRVELVNRAWERSLGWTLHELEEQHLDIYALAYPDPQYRQQVLDFVAAATGEWTDLKVRVRHGRVIDMTVAIVHLSDGTSLVIAQDITERKQAEATIRSLLQISEKLHATLDIDVLLDSLVIEAIKLIDAEMGWSGLRTEQGMVCHTHISPDLQVVPFKYFWPPGVGLPGWVLVHKVPYVMNDAQSDKLIIPEIRERFGVNAAIDTPILDAQGEVIGFFEVNNKKNGGGFSESDVEKLVAVSHVASIALQNAMSYANLERAEKALRESKQHLRLLSRQLLQAQEAERRSIARELHDEIGQQLTGLGLLLSSQHPSPDQLADAQAVVRDLIARLRNLALDLRPAMLDDLGLVPALVWLFDRYTAQTHVAVGFEHAGLEEQRFAPEVETTAYRIVQEALTNVARHAGVSEVTVRLWTDEDTLSVIIVDQGRGFDPQAIDTRTSTGLAGLQERAALLGGSLAIEARSGEGTRLTATLPLHGGGEAREQERSL